MKKDLSHTFYGVFGLGLSGLATLSFLLDKKVKFIAYDDNQANLKKAEDLLNGNKDSLCDLDDDQWSQIECLILSPGIPLYFPEPHKIVKIARKYNIEIICDIELFYRYFPNNIYIGITGTNGKSTTTALIGHILKANNIPCKVVGNIGIPILSVSPEKDDIIVIEVSSYQLDLIETVRFNAAILLNITKDHVERHGSLENYTKTKYKIFQTQTKVDSSIIDIDHSLFRNTLESLMGSLKSRLIKITAGHRSKDGISILDGVLYQDGIKVDVIPQPDSLLGKHNQENIAAAYAAVLSTTNITKEKILNSIFSFKGLPHRIEIVGKSGNLQFVNDSKATNFESTENALKIFDNIYWIAGGLPKEGGIEGIVPFKHKIIKAFLVGKGQEEFASTLEKNSIPYTLCGVLDKAFEEAVSQASASSKASIILLSPAAASLDQWKNFEERGNYFASLAKQYIDAHL